MHEVTITGELGAYCDDDELLNINNEWQITVEYESDITINDHLSNDEIMPTEHMLLQNYPNPFNPRTNIQFTVPEQSFVKLFIYDINGKTVYKIINSELKSGYYNVVWDGTNELGLKVGSGIYFYRLEAKNFTSSQKMIFIK